MTAPLDRSGWIACVVSTGPMAFTAQTVRVRLRLRLRVRVRVGVGVGVGVRVGLG